MSCIILHFNQFSITSVPFDKSMMRLTATFNKSFNICLAFLFLFVFLGFVAIKFIQQTKTITRISEVKMFPPISIHKCVETAPHYGGN